MVRTGQYHRQTDFKDPQVQYRYYPTKNIYLLKATGAIFYDVLFK